MGHTNKKPKYTIAISLAGGYVEDWYVSSVLDENKNIVSSAEASWLWVAKRQARKLRRLARKGIFFRA